jgi:nucleoid-associated protein YgaU|tara:strand:+ start:3959 stop:4252 length:294 start_codon:yes stop_codon:yes gene_type:complete
MNRYSYTKVKKDKNGVRCLKITRYPEILVRDTDTFHFARDFERFDWLANKYYNDSTLWWILAKANGYSHESRPKVGDKIRIPRDINSILQEFHRLNK